jgi:hypothetical protein
MTGKFRVGVLFEMTVSKKPVWESTEGLAGTRGTLG